MVAHIFHSILSLLVLVLFNYSQTPTDAQNYVLNQATPWFQGNQYGSNPGGPRQNQQKSYRRSKSYANGGCRNDYDFDYLNLELQWGPGICSTSHQPCTRMDNKVFTIHGMWPTNKPNNHHIVEDCCFQNIFDYNLIKPYEVDLNRYWFSYYDSDSRHFWSHEWLKHGTCSKNVSELKGEQKYFGQTLNIVKHLQVLPTLEENGVIPGPKRLYDYRLISHALKQISGGKDIGINCELQPSQPNPILKGVSFCFDRFLQFTDCPFIRSRCQKTLLFSNVTEI